MIVTANVLIAGAKRRRDNKGKFDQECRRTACRVMGARMWSYVEHGYYCEACAKEITRWSALVGVPPMVEHVAPGEPKPLASSAPSDL